MKNVYIITEITNGIIKVSPASSPYAAGKDMTGKGSVAQSEPQNICVTNPYAFPIKCGSAVHIGFSQSAELLRGFSALLIPLVIAGGALYVAPFAAVICKRVASPFFKAAFMSVCFLFSAAAVFFISRRTDITVEPRIISLAQSE